MCTKTPHTLYLLYTYDVSVFGEREKVNRTVLNGTFKFNEDWISHKKEEKILASPFQNTVSMRNEGKKIGVIPLKDKLRNEFRTKKV